MIVSLQRIYMNLNPQNFRGLNTESGIVGNKHRPRVEITTVKPITIGGRGLSLNNFLFRNMKMLLLLWHLPNMFLLF